MELTWSLDYCLACDRQTQGETYCSQTCRLADLESSTTWSAPTSPTTLTSSANANRGSGFYLSPAINFNAYKPSGTSFFPSASQSSSPLASYFPNRHSNQIDTSKVLTPSSSQTSLSSARSNSSQVNPISDQARTELAGYTNSFDNTRNWKKRITWT